MATKQKSIVNISFKQKIGLLVPYIKKRITAQIQSVALIVIYLICFQTIVLNIAISEAAIIATGIAVVVIGLPLFMEGLFLGLMPLGETIGIKLPQKTILPITLTFAFILGIGATFAEPAIGILKAAGTSVKAWEAPLLFLILNKYSNYNIMDNLHMDIDKKIAEITIVADKEIASTVLEDLESIGLQFSNSIAGRRDLLQERKGLVKMFRTDKVILYDPITTITFLVSSEIERTIISFITNKVGLNLPGRGSVFSKEVTLIKAHEQCQENKIQNIETKTRRLFSDLIGICCIAHRGDGDLFGKVGLETGGGIPAITLGIGTGLRDKIGLWRVTIPAEKEIVNLVTTSHNAESVMEMMIEIGALDHPGKGFIYLYPIKMGLVDVKAYVGLSRQAASIEQIVTVIDEIKGDTRWRRREFSKYRSATKKENI